jgi:hypothetical protein
MTKVIEESGMKPTSLKSNLSADVGSKGIGPHAMLYKSDRPAMFGNVGFEVFTAVLTLVLRSWIFLP